MAMPYKLIYNPHAGEKGHPFSHAPMMTLDRLQGLVRRYELAVDFFPTTGPKHATVLARASVNEGYETVIVAGGDGTVGEAANGLVGTNIRLGILPFGTFMNVARMLSIPTDLEQAMLLIKVGKTRKIDLGCVTKMEGEKLLDPYYFIESAGIGLDAQLQTSVLAWERKRYQKAWKALALMRTVYHRPITLDLDQKTMVVHASLVTIANGPVSGASLKVSPDSKLNDHQLSVSIFEMNRFEFIRHFWYLLRGKEHRPLTIQTFKTSRIAISATDDRPVHVDARLFGTLPAEFKIISEALTVIVGFPEERSESGLKERTYLAP